jgi:hypothetical protein
LWIAEHKFVRGGLPKVVVFEIRAADPRALYYQCADQVAIDETAGAAN